MRKKLWVPVYIVGLTIIYMNWIQPLADAIGWDYYPTLLAFIVCAAFILFLIYQCIKCMCAGPICIYNTLYCVIIQPLNYCLINPCMDSIFSRKTVTPENMKYKPVDVDDYI